MMNGLVMKYFVLKPKGNCPYAIASRRALETYAHCIEIENPQLAKDLRKWSQREMPNKIKQ